MNQGGAVTTTNTNTVAQQLADHFDLDLDLAERIVADINEAIDDLSRPPRKGQEVLWRDRHGRPHIVVVERVYHHLAYVRLPGNGLLIEVADWRTLGDPFGDPIEFDVVAERTADAADREVRR